MNYIIFDLEMNSKAFKSSMPNEIIEIGAVKLDDNLNVVSKFQSFVRPKIFRKLFPVVKRKTKILQIDINEAENFKEVLTRFKSWLGTDYILCSWGHDDIYHLKSNCELNRRSTNWLKRHVDIQKHFSKLYDFPAGHRASLEKALELLNIPLEDGLHRADIDAIYTAKIFINIFERVNFLKNISTD